MIGIATTRDRTIHAGALVQIDARNHADPACMDGTAYASATTGQHACLDEENATFKILTPDVPAGSAPSPVGRYREPSLLPDGRILVSWADGPVNDLNEQSLTPPDFGIYIYDPASGRTSSSTTIARRGSSTRSPSFRAPSRRSSATAQNTQDATKPVRIGSVERHARRASRRSSPAPSSTRRPLGQALKQGAVKVRVIEGFSSEAAKGVTMFGLTMHEGAAVLGEAPVYTDGSWLANVPPYLPVHLQPIDKFGLAIRNQRLWIQGMPGEDRRCVGCHESRTSPGSASAGPNTVAEQHQAVDFTEPIANRTEYPWDKKIQPLLDAKCVSCHNGSTTGYYYMSRTDPVTGTQTTYKIPTSTSRARPSRSTTIARSRPGPRRTSRSSIPRRSRWEATPPPRGPSRSPARSRRCGAFPATRAPRS